MTKKGLLLPFLLLCFVQFSVAQHVYCGQQRAMNNLADQIPSFKQAVQQTFAEAKRNAQTPTTSRSNEALQVQVVVHVVHNTDVQNISDDLITEQIAILNEDFQSLNADPSEC